MRIKLDAGNAAGKLRAILADSRIPKAIHDYKAAIHSLQPLGVEIEGVQHDPVLYSYLLDPTYSSHQLADIRCAVSI